MTRRKPNPMRKWVRDIVDLDVRPELRGPGVGLNVEIKWRRGAEDQDMSPEGVEWDMLARDVERLIHRALREAHKER